MLPQGLILVLVLLPFISLLQELDLGFLISASEATAVVILFIYLPATWEQSEEICIAKSFCLLSQDLLDHRKLIPSLGGVNFIGQNGLRAFNKDSMSCKHQDDEDLLFAVVFDVLRYIC